MKVDIGSNSDERGARAGEVRQGTGKRAKSGRWRCRDQPPHPFVSGGTGEQGGGGEERLASLGKFYIL